MTPLQIAIFSLACLLIGLSKGGLGGPLPVSLIVPLLALVMDAKEVLPLILPFLIFGDLFALRVYWKQWDMHQIKLMLPSGIVGAIAGGLLLSRIDDTVLKIIIAVVTVIAIIYKLVSNRLESLRDVYKPRSWHSYFVGWVGAFASTVANNGGIPMSIYLLLIRMKPVPFIGTITLYFAIINVIKIPLFWQQGLFDFQLLVSVLWAIPIIPIGIWLGRKSLDYISPLLFERIMLGLLALGVIILLVNL